MARGHTSFTSSLWEKVGRLSGRVGGRHAVPAIGEA